MIFIPFMRNICGFEGQVGKLWWRVDWHRRLPFRIRFFWGDPS